jgi:hypothetical protein
MSIASRHGKLFIAADDDGTRAVRIEDLLTGDIFGAYRYLPVQLGIGRLLGAATTADAISMREWAAERGIDWSRLTRLWIRFWPWLATRKQPDIVLALGDRQGPAIAVLIEVKLHSEQHEIGEASQLGYYGCAFQEGSFAEPPFDFELPSPRPIVFLTNHPTIPEPAVRRARRELLAHRSDSQTEVFWASWRSSIDLADEAIEELRQDGAPAYQLAVLEDLVADLENRGIRRTRALTSFPLNDLDALGDFPAPWLRDLARYQTRSLRDLRSLSLARIDIALADWNL